jgi:hypothetical protein
LPFLVCDDGNPIISHRNVYKPEERLLTTQRKDGKIVWCMFICGCKQDHLGETAMHSKSIVQAPSLTLASGVTISDSKMAREVTELVEGLRKSLSGALRLSETKPATVWQLPDC